MKQLYVMGTFAEFDIGKCFGVIPYNSVYVTYLEHLVGWVREGVCVIFVGNYNKNPEIEKMVDLVFKYGYLYFIQGDEMPRGIEKYIR